MEWKNIKGYEGLYQVSDTGLVRSLDREIESKGCHKKKRFWQGKEINPNVGNNGYYGIRLSKDGIIKRFLIHRLVLISFIGNEPTKDVNHIDGIKSNNSLLNLEWVTKSENSKHAEKLGLLKRTSFKVRLLKDGFDYIFDSMRLAQRELKINNLSRCKSGDKVSGYTVYFLE